MGTKGSGKGGKGVDLRARVADVSILPQGAKITSTKHKIYEEHDLFYRPMVVANAQGKPIAHNSIADLAVQHQVRLETQRGLEELHAILIKAHGPLHRASTPREGEPIVVQIRIKSALLFSDPDWSQILMSIPISTWNPGFKKFELGIQVDFARGDCDLDIRNVLEFIDIFS
jgi:hypothetical protein